MCFGQNWNIPKLEASPVQLHRCHLPGCWLSPLPQCLQQSMEVPLIRNRPCCCAAPIQIPVRQQQCAVQAVRKQPQGGVNISLLRLQKGNAVHQLGGIIISVHPSVVNIFHHICYYIRIPKVHASKGHGNQREVNLIRNCDQCLINPRDEDPNIKQDKPCCAHASQVPQNTALAGNVIFNGHKSRYDQLISDNQLVR